jgi:two-component system, LytTR family, response regulator
MKCVFMELYSKISLRIDGRVLIINTENILYCQADGPYTHINMVNGKRLTLCKSLSSIQTKFFSSAFYRCHNSYFINMLRIDEYNIRMNHILINGIKIPISRRKKHLFLDLLIKYFDQL